MKHPLVVLIWVCIAGVWIGLFQAYGIAGFAIMLGAYILVKHLRKKSEIWNKDRFFVQPFSQNPKTILFSHQIYLNIQF